MSPVSRDLKIESRTLQAEGTASVKEDLSQEIGFPTLA